MMYFKPLIKKIFKSNSNIIRFEYLDKGIVKYYRFNRLIEKLSINENKIEIYTIYTKTLLCSFDKRKIISCQL